MHVLISVYAALMMQTPGVHFSALDAAMAVEKAAVSQDRVAPFVGRASQGHACPCLNHRPAN